MGQLWSDLIWGVQMERHRFALPQVVVSIVYGIALSSCAGASEGEQPVLTVTDSTGVEIVTNAVPVWESGGGWSTSESPTLEIGTVSGAEAYTLYRVGAVIMLREGRIAIANGGTSQIRVYDADGVHLHDIGRNGDGPGEFRALGGVWRSRGDSIMTADSRLSRITIFGSEGRLGRMIRVTPSGGARQVFGRRPFDDGSLLISGVVLPAQPPREGLFDGGSQVFDRYSSDGSHLNRIGEQPRGSNWGFTLQGRIAYTVAPFAVFSPPNASDGSAVYLGAGTQLQVEKRGADGELLRIIRWAGEPRPVTSDVIARYRSEQLEQADTPEFRQSVESMLEGLVFPEHIPVYQSLLVDTEDHLWVERYRTTWEDERRWWVFDPSGRWMGEAPVPTDLDIREVGSDYVLGVRRDESNVERVVVYGLSRGS